MQDYLLFRFWQVRGAFKFMGPQILLQHAQTDADHFLSSRYIVVWPQLHRQVIPVCSEIQA